MACGDPVFGPVESIIAVGGGGGSAPVIPIVDVDHADFEKIAVEVAELVADKQKKYSDSFGKSGAVLRILYPNGIKLERYDDVLTLVRMIDKMFRIAAADDGVTEEPFADLMGYALLAESRRRKNAQ